MGLFLHLLKSRCGARRVGSSNSFIMSRAQHRQAGAIPFYSCCFFASLRSCYIIYYAIVYIVIIPPGLMLCVCKYTCYIKCYQYGSELQVLAGTCSVIGSIEYYRRSCIRMFWPIGPIKHITPITRYTIGTPCIRPQQDIYL